VEATAAEPAAAPAADTSADTSAQTEDVPAEQVVHFEFASKDISADDSDVLARHVVYLQAHPKAKLRLEGYTDSRGSEKYNKALGERRARAVRDFLIQAGVKARQLLVQSYGSEKPVAEGSDEEAWAKNRRVALVYQSR
jgi:peptidoglycan-associated lipoprotein